MRWLALLAVLAFGSAAADYRVSVGSFREPANARSVRDTIDLPSLAPFVVERATSANADIYRVLSRPYPSREAAEAALARARTSGYASAWLLATTEPPVANPSVIVPSPATPSTTVAAVKRSSSVDRETPVAQEAERRPMQLVTVGDEGGSSGAAMRIHRYQGDESAIEIDGVLDEPFWQDLPVHDEFVVLDPDTLEPATYGTQIRFAYTDEGLYLGADLEQPKETLIERLSGRDVRELNRDNINITIDSSGEGLYGFWFGINLGGSLMDGTALPERQFSNEWDGPWRGASAETDHGWSAEFFIPWSTMSMPAVVGVRQMGIYMSRKVAHLDERWGWPALPSTQPRFMSALMPIAMQGISPTQQYSIYPFSGTTIDGIDDEVRYRVGADLFWRPSSNFQVIATVNPDFGSVESDDAVINLTATETFFPEKRLFFLEGQEIFTASPRADTRSRGVGRGGPPTTLLNTRRIGGKAQSPDLLVGTTVSKRERIRPVDLLGAVKVAGQAGGFRYGVLGAFEDDVKFNGIQGGTEVNLHQDGSDYGAARLFYENSSGGSYKAVGVLSTAVMHHDRDAFATGIDWHYLSPGGKMKTDGQVFRSDLDGKEAGYGGFWDFEYTFRQGLRQRLGLEYFDEHVDINDLGFQSRNNYMQVRTAHTRTSSGLGWARNNQFDARGALRRNLDGYFTSSGLFLANRITFNNLTTFTARVSHFFPGYDDLNSFGNGIYRVEEKSGGALSFESDTSSSLSFLVGAGYLEEDLGGDSYDYEFKINWRPNGRFSLEAGARYFDRRGWLLHQGGGHFTTFNAEQWLPRLNVEYFISARQQLRLSVQLVGVRAKEDEFYLVPATPGDLVATTKPPGPSDSFAISDMVFQLRYRWELAPLSDLFIVYARTSDISAALGDATFDDLLSNAWNGPIGDQLVIKLRYRFGS